MKTTTPSEFAKLHTANNAILLLDVRTPAEFRSVHATPAKNLPLTDIDSDSLASLQIDKNDSVYLICESGGRSAKACAKLEALGYENPISVDGGTAEWKRLGLSVEIGKQSVSIERQVRIVAGLLVATSVILSRTTNPGFAWIALAVGLGLAFAGITNTCTMGMILAKMPWNR